MIRFLLCSLLLFFLWNCHSEQDETKQYLFLGHSYNWHNPYKIDPRLEKFDFQKFDQVWLGGDVCAQTSEKESTLQYLDSLFDLDSDRLHWAIGNHDLKEGDLNLITRYTKRPDFYTTWVDGICLMVLNTNLFWFYDSAPPAVDCEKKEAQLAMIETVLDTIKDASHLVILHHHALLNKLKEDGQGNVSKVFNINPLTIRPGCDSTILLTSWLYPRLKQIQAKDISVILIGGDFGMRAKEFAFQTQEGIWLLGSGINNSVPLSQVPAYVTSLDPDKILMLEHRPGRRELSWSFVLLDESFQNLEFWKD